MYSMQIFISIVMVLLLVGVWLIRMYEVAHDEELKKNLESIKAKIDEMDTLLKESDK